IIPRPRKHSAWLRFPRVQANKSERAENILWPWTISVWIAGGSGPRCPVHARSDRQCRFRHCRENNAVRSSHSVTIRPPHDYTGAHTTELVLSYTVLSVWK